MAHSEEDRSPREIILAFDSDEAGLRAADRAIQRLYGLQPPAPLRTLSDWELAAEFEHWDRLQEEAVYGTETWSYCEYWANTAAFEIRRRAQLRYTPAKPGYDLKKILEDLRERVDIVAVFTARTDYSAFAESKRSRNNTITIRCPFHDDRSPSLTLYTEQQTWWCFGCQQGGDSIDAVMLFEQRDFVPATLVLAREFGVATPAYSQTSSAEALSETQIWKESV